jgi:putative ABC transport system permease protein
VENGKGARMFIPLSTAQDIARREGFATIFYIKVRDKAETAAVIGRLQNAIPGFDILDVEEFATQMFGSIKGLLDTFFQVVVFLGVSIGILVIFLSMYTTVTERTREIGILRSMGASKSFIVALILQESLILCVIGTIVGIGVSFAGAVLVKALAPTVIIMITPTWIVQASILAMISGVVGSLYPAYKAASQDPIEALAYE